MTDEKFDFGSEKYDRFGEVNPKIFRDRIIPETIFRNPEIKRSLDLPKDFVLKYPNLDGLAAELREFLARAGQIDLDRIDKEWLSRLDYWEAVRVRHLVDFLRSLPQKPAEVEQTEEPKKLSWPSEEPKRVLEWGDEPCGGSD